MITTMHEQATRCAEVALDAPTTERRQLFSYLVPAHLAGQVQERQLVWAPLKDELRVGIVVRLTTELPPFPLRPLHAVVEPTFRLAPWQWELVEWLSEETLCTLFEAASPFLPPGITQRTATVLQLRDPATVDLDTLTPLQRRLVQLLQERGPITLETARRALNRSLTTVVERLVTAGIIERTARVQAQPSAVQRYVQLVADPPHSDGESAQRAQAVLRDWEAAHPGQPMPWQTFHHMTRLTLSTTRELAQTGVLRLIELPPLPVGTSTHVTSIPTLSPAQADAWRAIHAALHRQEFAGFLLHGVTGSGKTELYLRATAECLRQGRQAIILVPEIALTSQIVERFASRFPGHVVVFHSGLRPSERWAAWHAVARGEAPIVVGPRSALFVPVQQLGLIVIDEEHDAAYKQESVPRYHARAVAQQLAQRHHAVLLLGSATPDVTTRYAAEIGALHLLRLPERVGPVVLHRRQAQPVATPLPLPQTTIVDMRLELQRGNRGLFSTQLQQAIARALAAHEQAIVLLNRRGLATVVQCRACGAVLECPACETPLVYHADLRRLICHRCGVRRSPLGRCPRCRHGTLGYYGAGTERVERELARLFPTARILRWDQDVVRQAGDVERLVRLVQQHAVDIVVGTQMVAKGFDFPLVSTVGIVNADTQLYLPDYRAGERTFQLLTQVAGRAGRKTPGAHVIIQTYTPDHYAIQAASQHDYERFYTEELAFRKRHRYPPFCRLVRLVYRHSDALACQLSAEAAADRLRQARAQLGIDAEVLGPTPAFIAKIRGRYQWQILVRGAAARELVAAVPLGPGWLIDVDPISLL